MRSWGGIYLSPRKWKISSSEDIDGGSGAVVRARIVCSLRVYPRPSAY